MNITDKFKSTPYQNFRYIKNNGGETEAYFFLVNQFYKLIKGGKHVLREKVIMPDFFYEENISAGIWMR